MSDRIVIQPGQVSLETLRTFHETDVSVELSDACWDAVDQSHSVVQSRMAEGHSIYGLNTGFGLLAGKPISASDLAQLQLNLVRSHSAGTGPLLSAQVVRLAMLLKVNSLARGYSGVRRDVIMKILELLDSNIIPCVPSQGSVGASGDLAPLAHMTMALIGEGQVLVDGAVREAGEALRAAGLTALTLGPKEGLALLNGTQVSTALALDGLFAFDHIFHAAIVSGCLSVDAAMGSDTPFDPRIHEIRNHPGQIDCARMYRELMAGSKIRASHVHCDRVQDPYSLRCQPQVMGSCLESLRHAATVLLRESNSVSDNPLVFADDQSILSGGNFHAEPVALVADELAVAIAEVGALSERRIALLIDRHLSNLPSFLVKDSGFHSGFMIPQVTAASLVAENQHLASPISVNSLPTSANQEDHVSMATYAARRLRPMSENTATIVAIEMLAACQGLDFRVPLVTSPRLQSIHADIRRLAAFYDRDRPFSQDMESVKQHVLRTDWRQVVGDSR